MSIGGPMSWDTRSQYLTVPHSIHQYTSSVRKAAASVGVTVTSPVKESSPGASYKKASWTMTTNAIPKRNPAPLNTAKRRVAAIRTRGRPVLGTNVTTFAGVSRSRWGNCSARIGADERYRRNCAKDWRGQIERENARLSLVSLENRSMPYGWFWWKLFLIRYRSQLQAGARTDAYQGKQRAHTESARKISACLLL